MGSKPTAWGRNNRPPSVSSPGVFATAGPRPGLAIASGGSGSVSYRVANNTGRRILVDWTAQATGSLALSRTAGSLSVEPHSATTVRVGVTAGVANRPRSGWCSVSFSGREGTGAIVPTASVPVNIAPPGDLAPFYDEVGSVDDGQPVGSGYNGSFTLYSATALAAAGISPGKRVTAAGIDFRWPDVASGQRNCVRAAGQTIPLPARSGTTTLGFLGSATHGADSGSAGTVTITYTDGSTQRSSVVFSDWTLHDGKGAPTDAETIVVAAHYQNSCSGGRHRVKTYLFAVTVAVDSAKRISSITLPAGSPGVIGIFAVGTDS
jgi:hypothetical protein